MKPGELLFLADAIRADRLEGTETDWWRDRIGDFALDEDMGQYGGQDAADKRRILRTASLEAAFLFLMEQYVGDDKRGEKPKAPAWQPIETAPKDGTWFVGAVVREGEMSAPEWKPIETAPKDGTLVLVWFDDDKAPYWDGSGKQTLYTQEADVFGKLSGCGMALAAFVIEHSGDPGMWHAVVGEPSDKMPVVFPLFWMPLPAPPKESER